uniref:Uncharacterized protein n=1 Tax=Glossina austeni TaxID=7395 RepID=A0A1A9UMK8_GLOAU
MIRKSSHATDKARWLGVCPSYLEAAAAVNNVANTAASCAATAATQMCLATELCARLEQLSTSSSSASTHMPSSYLCLNARKFIFALRTYA